MTMRVPLLDLSAQNQPLRAAVLEAIARVVDSGHFIMGPDVEACERELGATTPAAHVIGVSSGTDALLVALMALGHRPGRRGRDHAVLLLRHRRRDSRVWARARLLADIDPASFNLDPRAAVAACTSRTRAVITVHLYGRASERPDVTVPIVEDAAQSIGSARLTGLCGCMSFFPSKNLGAFGDAGAVYSDDAAFADRVRLLRTHGGRPKYYHQAIGGNFRLDTLQAAVLRVKLPHLAAWTAARRANAERYRLLAGAHARFPAEVRLPDDAPGHIYNQFVVRAPRRDALRDFLTKAASAPRSTTRCPSTCSPASPTWNSAKAPSRTPRPPRARRWPCPSTPS